MTCPDCTRELAGTTCVCGWQAPALAPVAQWVIRSCATPGCAVKIRSRITDLGPPTCKWCRTGTAYNTASANTSPPAGGPLLSREEFGDDLYHAIRLNAARLQCEANARLYQRKGLTAQAAGATQKAVTCQKELQSILDRGSLAPDDLRRLLTMA